MISYYIELFFGVFVFGFGFGSAFYLLSIAAHSEILKVGRTEIMKMTEESWRQYFIAKAKLEEEQSKNSYMRNRRFDE